MHLHPCRHGTPVKTLQKMVRVIFVWISCQVLCLGSPDVFGKQERVCEQREMPAEIQVHIIMDNL